MSGRRNFGLLAADDIVASAGKTWMGLAHPAVCEVGLCIDDEVGRCLLSFIQQFLQVFPELRKAPLFIAGDSYAGKSIPAFGHNIHHSKDNSKPINLRVREMACRSAMDGLIHRQCCTSLSGRYKWASLTKYLNKLESEARKNWRDHHVSAYIENVSKAGKMLLSTVPVDIYNYMNGEGTMLASPLISSIETFLNKPEVQNALHIVEKKFSVFNLIVNDWLRRAEYLTAKPWLEELVEHYGVMCYNGQLVMVPYALSVRTYRSLKWSGRQDYLDASIEHLYDEENSCKINSFVKTSGNVMEAMVVGAGHMVPADKPRAAQQLFDLFNNRYKQISTTVGRQNTRYLSSR